MPLSVEVLTRGLSAAVVYHVSVYPPFPVGGDRGIRFIATWSFLGAVNNTLVILGLFVGLIIKWLKRSPARPRFTWRAKMQIRRLKIGWNH